MKKSKILAVFGILLAMGITACGGGNNNSNSGDAKSQDAPKTQESAGGDESKPASEHKHSYGEWKQTKAPTCTEKGEEERVCECGEKQTKSVNALGHDWGEWAVKTEATCTVDGVEERACKRAGCTAKEERPIKADHKYGDPATVAASGDGVEYTKEVCSVDGTIRLKVNQSKVTYASGSSRKGGTPDGYTKLNSNGNTMSFKFNYDHFAVGKLYLYGCMDGYSTDSNRAAGLYYQGNPNVEIKVNGSVVDVSAQKETTYSSIFGDEYIETGLESPSNYLSNEGYFPVGDIFLQDGVNELIYKRVATLNMLIKDFVFVINNSEHVHTAAETWSSDDEQHWHACTALGCPTGKADAPANHTFGEWEVTKAATCKEAGERQHACTVCGKVVKEAVAKLDHTLGEAYDVVPATCQAAGSQKKKCSVCEEVITEVLPKTNHNFGEVVENYAAGEGYIATTAHNCSMCEKSALRWSALDYDATASSSGLDKQSAYVRFASGTVENKNGAESTGSHIIYKVNVAAAQEKAGLAFKIKNTNGSGYGANVSAPVFNTISGDSSLGAIKNADGSFTTATKRYGLKVNGVEYFLGDDNYGNQSGVTGWFEWPTEFPLQAGVNTIDIFAYAGYRAQLMEFELTGLPHVTPSHIHNGDAAWLTDADNHWHACTAEGCPIADGIYDKAAHTFGEPYDVVAATCTAKGSYKVKCSVCDYVKTVEVDKVAHTWGDAQTAVGDAIPHECSVCHAVGYELTVASPSKLKADITWNITGLPAGNYEIQLNACASATTLPQKYDSRYQFKVDDGDYIGASNDNATYADYGLGTGEAIANVKWSKAINVIEVGATAASFTLHWTNKGYSAFIAGVRLVKVAA